MAFGLENLRENSGAEKEGIENLAAAEGQTLREYLETLNLEEDSDVKRMNEALIKALEENTKQAALAEKK